MTTANKSIMDKVPILLRYCYISSLKTRRSEDSTVEKIDDEPEVGTEGS